ncbi:hypothetical protein GFC01_08415 [Desulfofundulus thermobenzoicus]|uniref:Uncharacterized protein n=1 Tax=Desulfofundulus thermobenzoicus TaxID=29376 RepID=A0A6N7IQI4_9FIRM|nr:hypothetical protein [Desulfofundulus thermobenzoicus]
MTVPLSAAGFYRGLARRFPERDGMYFLPDQAAEYDRKRMTVREVLATAIVCHRQATAIQWLKQRLTKRPGSSWTVMIAPPYSQRWRSF